MGRNHIASTTVGGRLECFVLIRQSAFPGLCQFWVDGWMMAEEEEMAHRQESTHSARAVECVQIRNVSYINYTTVTGFTKWFVKVLTDLPLVPNTTKPTSNSQLEKHLHGCSHNHQNHQQFIHLYLKVYCCCKHLCNALSLQFWFPLCSFKLIKVWDKRFLQVES